MGMESRRQRCVVASYFAGPSAFVIAVCCMSVSADAHLRVGADVGGKSLLCASFARSAGHFSMCERSVF